MILQLFSGLEILVEDITNTLYTVALRKVAGKKSVKKHAEISLVLFSFTSGFQRNLRKVIVGTRHRRLDEVIYLNC